MSWLVDAHVHYHECFGWARFLESAAKNFDDEARARSRSYDAGVLLFVEMEGEDQRGAFARQPEAHLPRGWGATSLDCMVVRVDRPGGSPLFLLAGRQIATKERLEVLALGCAEALPDGLPLAETVGMALESSHCVAIPWGFGKWWSSRGRLLADFLDGDMGSRVHLGDNANRAAGWPAPKLFEHAGRSGRAILPGSDPLPFAAHVARVGAFGFWLEGALDPQQPGQSIALALREEPALQSYGRLRAPVSFVFDQLRMQWIARRRTQSQEGPA